MGRLLYQISTEGGQSGAPIMIKKEGSLVVIGLHQGGYKINMDG
jgi:V8-like Glu-specific endopeptidase